MHVIRQVGGTLQELLHRFKHFPGHIESDTVCMCSCTAMNCFFSRPIVSNNSPSPSEAGHFDPNQQAAQDRLGNLHRLEQLMGNSHSHPECRSMRFAQQVHNV